MNNTDMPLYTHLHAGDQRSHDLIQYYHNNTPTNNPKQNQKTAPQVALGLNICEENNVIIA